MTWVELRVTYEAVDEADSERVWEGVEAALCPNPGHGPDGECGRQWILSSKDLGDELEDEVDDEPIIQNQLAEANKIINHQRKQIESLESLVRKIEARENA